MNEAEPSNLRLMALSRIERRSLALYREFQNRPMTVRGLIWFSRRTYLLLISYFAALVAYFYFAFGSDSCFTVLAVCGAFLFRDFSYLRASTRAWPALREVIRWDAVSAMLDTTNDNSRNA